MFSDALTEKAAALLALYRAKGLRISTAESCTGGLISALLTEIPGSSDVFERGFVTYSNDAKKEMLGVDAALLDAYGAVSAQVAQAMAVGALRHSQADVAVAITGVAGPGASEHKPAGLVFIGLAAGDELRVLENRFEGGRGEVRAQTVEMAISQLAELVD